ncbi:MAG: peptidylprolyl isomerase [Bacteroidales bacterium]|nr:peptidylprolyl isomerase [Bacteroidales bacterium]
MRKFIYLLSAFISVMTLSCTDKTNINRDDVVAEVNGRFLYKADLAPLFKRGVSNEDSVKIVENFRDNWIKESLLYDKAERNIDNLEEIDKNVEEYRRRMVIFQYEKELINERLEKEIDEQELESFYEIYSSKFVLKDPIIKGIFLKIPVNAPQLEEVKKWVKKITPETLEKLEKYTLQNAIVYEYFSDRWVSLQDIMNNIPYVIGNSSRFLKENKFLDVSEGDYWYFLSVSDYKLEGSAQPFEYAKAQIKDALLTQKKKSFINDLEEQLYKDGLENGKVKIENK